MKLPFLPYKKQERAFRSFLRTYAGLSVTEALREANTDANYLARDLTYSDLQEIFDAGWKAAENAIKRSTDKPRNNG